MKIAVVILNWNGQKFLEQFLPRVVETSRGIAEVIVADNASTDDSVSFLNLHFPEVRIIKNPDNGGFAKGYNQALKQVDSEYYILLNSDIEVTDNWIEPVIKLMDSDKNIAACQPKILSYHQKNKFEYAGAAGGFIDKLGYPFCRGRLFQSIEEDKGQYDDIAEIFWATGACMFVRSEYYHRLGGLDEDFFAHMEEIDFCWRAKHKGYKIMYCPDSKVYHVGGGTLPKISAWKTYLNMRNNNTMLYKNLPREQVYPVFIKRFFLDLAASFKFLVDGGIKDFIAVSRAHIGFYFSYKKNRNKRSKIAHRHVSMIYNDYIVFDHFLKGIKKFSLLEKEKFT